MTNIRYAIRLGSIVGAVFVAVACRSTLALDTKQKPGVIRAVSIEILQQQALAAGGPLSRDVASLAGVTTVLGYINDESSQDCLVYGFADPASAVELHTEDFCVALRNVWMKYAPLHGDTYNYDYPGCSIDPDPDTMRKLNEVGRSANSSDDPEKVKHQLEEWQAICRGWQAVRVMGTPFNCRFAADLVSGDYDMKLLVNGSDMLNIPGFISLVGMKLEAVREAVTHGKPIEVSLAGMNRFWFYPGTNRYVEDDGIVWIKQCPVILLTEEMALSRKGGLGGSGHADPMAKQFTEDFSKLYSKVAEDRPIYRRAENLLRFFILAQIMQFKELRHPPELNLDSRLAEGCDLSGLLEKFPVGNVSVATKLAGRSAIKEFKHEETKGNTTSTYQLWLQSCGGVEMRHKVKPEEFTHPAPALKRLKKAILAARPRGDSLYWDLGADSAAVTEIRNALRLAALNIQVGGLETAIPDRATVANPRQGYVLPTEPNRRRRTVGRVEFGSPGFQLFSDAGAIFDGNSIAGLVDTLQTSGMFDNECLTIETKDLAGENLAHFRSAVRLAAGKLQRELSVMFVNLDSGSDELLFDNAVSPGIALDPPSQAEETEELLTRKNLSLSFITRDRGQTQKFYLDILSDRPNVRKEMLSNILGRMPGGRSSENLYRISQDARIEAERKNKLHNKDIPIRFRNENGVLETGAVLSEMKSEPA